MVIVTGEVGAGGVDPDPGTGAGVGLGVGGGPPDPVGLGCGLGPVVGGGDGGGGRVGGGVVGGGVVGGGVVGGGVVGGGVGVAAGAAPRAAGAADFAALGQAGTVVSETAADAIRMIAPSPVRRMLMPPDCPPSSAGREQFAEAGLPAREGVRGVSPPGRDDRAARQGIAGRSVVIPSMRAK
jgi:hypothetical protein